MNDHRDMPAFRDDRREGYPLPCDPVSGTGWWRFNMLLCLSLEGYAAWQAQKLMAELIPTIRWLIYGPIPERTKRDSQ